jgi:hypothetical protein
MVQIAAASAGAPWQSWDPLALLASVTAPTLTRDPGGPAQFACMFFFNKFICMLFSSNSLAAAVLN